MRIHICFAILLGFLSNVGAASIMELTGRLTVSAHLHEDAKVSSPLTITLETGSLVYLVARENGWTFVGLMSGPEKKWGYARTKTIMAQVSNLAPYESGSSSSKDPHTEEPVSDRDVKIRPKATGFKCEKSLFDQSYKTCSIDVDVEVAVARVALATVDLSCTGTVNFYEKESKLFPKQESGIGGAVVYTSGGTGSESMTIEIDAPRASMKPFVSAEAMKVTCELISVH
jgi:hypothetical protein